jgi:mono/diheme cytochrome c family protein
MKNLSIFALIGCLLGSCESTMNYVPPVTPQMAAGKETKPAELVRLREGRRLFVHRCIECHTLPPLWHYTTKDWREIVSSMSRRASLNPEERNAIVAYILAVRARSH